MGSLQKSVEHKSEIREVLKKWVSVFDQTKKGFLRNLKRKRFSLIKLQFSVQFGPHQKGVLGYRQNQMKNVFWVKTLI